MDIKTDILIKEIQSLLNIVIQHLKEQDEQIQLLSEQNIDTKYSDKNVSPLGLVPATKAAEMIGIKSVNTMYSMMDEKIIPEVRFKSLRFVHIDDINRYIQKQREQNKKGRIL